MEQNFETEVLTRLTKIETKLDDYKSVKDKSDTAYTIAIENQKEIEEINERIKWITRTVVAAVITGVIGIGIALLKSGIGIH
ncbi:MAG: hypothetical protein HFJ36_05505 [Clostridia bacterium]|nr:hypothetical protein [Clostridia bacterium]